ncbi:tetratricopeptide (TPR) repeat protein [Lactobacillus colini]|uniref:Tetratricopeptide (TPR) repeat protein n=1 Tax=Lactobacillus colini TaxID=1819254 RepID=A0ABS4MDK6_9LACO|nr:hypothetical protein [Lactobacillus colini]MBP2057771.1 tetratricopeptide (TPR) repeat protein [Lactobacillus colini]
MPNASQSNLLSLADLEIQKDNIDNAIQHLLEALRIGYSSEIVYKLCNLLLKQNKFQQAYTLIKEEPDLFSDSRTYNLYLKILKGLDFNIEALEIENLSGKKIDVNIFPASERTQRSLMKNFKELRSVSEQDYHELYRLSKANFIQLAQSLLIDPTQSFALKLSFCEDLIKLGYDKEVTVSIMGENKFFIPKETVLLQKDPIYQECCASLADYLRRDPNKIELMIGELNICLGMLYPKLHDYISDPDQFTHDFRHYLENKHGGTNQNLLDKVYQYMSYEELINNSFD